MSKPPIFPKSSIFIRMFLPIIGIMVLLVGFINLFLHINGTVRELNDRSVDILAKNVQIRGDNLERLMVHYWSNVDRLEYEVLAATRAFLAQESITIDELLGNDTHEIALLGELSSSLLDALRVGASTGVFIYFLNGDGFSEEVHTLNGLYYRNLSPLTHIHANIIFLRGHVDIARRDNIPTDSLWEEYFTFDPQHTDIWRGFAYPQLAAEAIPQGASGDLSYWNAPHFFNPPPRVDANLQITYNRPIIFEGRPIAMIGTDMQMTHIDRHIPQRDLDTFAESGYMLIRYDTRQIRADGSISGDVLRITGGVMHRLLGGYTQVTMRCHPEGGQFILETTLGMRGYAFPLHLYNHGTPFAHESWMLAAISTEHSLFEMTRIITNTIIVSSVVAVLLGGFILFLLIKTVLTTPIGAVIKQLKISNGDETVGFKTNVRELDELTDTFNSMIEQRLIAERYIHEERQRYLLALESSSDTFIEYDIEYDVLTFYFFSEASSHTPESVMVENFQKQAHIFLHADDVSTLASNSSYELRIKTEYVDHIKNVDSDNGYYWFFVKSMMMHDENGKPLKIFGTAREITEEKKQEAAKIARSQRDENTGFLNKRYGLEQVQRKRPPYLALSLVTMHNFSNMELAYGLIFGGIFIAQLAQALREIVGNDGVIVRTGNDEFLICYDLPPSEARRRDEKIIKGFNRLYAGELPEHKPILEIKTPGVINSIQFTANETPIKVNPNNKENISLLALEMYERTSFVGASTRKLIGLIGRLFALDRVVVCLYDTNFSTSQVIHEWHKEGVSAPHREVRRVSHKGFRKLASMLENDACIYTTQDTPDAALTHILCIPANESVSIFCCTHKEQEVFTGSVLFMSCDQARVWDEHDKTLLDGIANVISSFINAEKARSASQAKSKFLSKVSHEIRTPMNAILGMTNIAIDAVDESNHPRVKDCLEKINVSANYLLSLINDVLEVSRIESGKTMQVEEKPFSLAHFVQTIEAVIRFSIENNGITFAIENNIQNDFVIGDAYRLKQVIINLLGNANKFTEEGGTITLSIDEQEAGQFRFAVKDTGVGISRDKHEAIFNPFEQVDTPNGSGQQGTGLGLSISRNIISAMDSTIELESEPNQGAEFSFTLSLPLANPGDITQGDDEKNKHDTTVLAGKRILAVDDVTLNLEIVTFILEGVNIIVETAENGHEALEMFIKNPPNYYDAILMDIQMPVMDGITAVRELRGMSYRRDAQEIPIIALTANAFDEDFKKSAESGMNCHISKPVDGNELLQTLYTFITLEGKHES
ncbi:MAG: ATP-binding protein [Defluviitaleaceae bacterium]|nr:ATP-binding protein [Defluviitaleaceae bacterium]MCL2273808.1 ATP-binding protein [Defluviitaleaceae bacterium]